MSEADIKRLMATILWGSDLPANQILESVEEIYAYYSKPKKKVKK